MRISKICLSFIFLIIVIAISWISSCTHKPDIDDLPVVCFERDVLPVFKNSCAISGCHDGQGQSDLILNSYLNIIEEIEPGDPADSEIYQAITATSGEDRMPPDQPLSEYNRTLIRIWIEQGANQTTCAGK